MAARRVIIYRIKEKIKTVLQAVEDWSDGWGWMFT